MICFFYRINFSKKPKILQKWQNKFDFILVDEAQDTNRIQFELMKLLTGSGANITLIEMIFKVFMDGEVL